VRPGWKKQRHALLDDAAVRAARALRAALERAARPAAALRLR
jgi:hypothetical protein